MNVPTGPPVAQATEADDGLKPAFTMLTQHHAAVVGGTSSANELEAMAREEAALYERLNPEERFKVYRFAMTLFSKEGTRTFASGDLDSVTSTSALSEGRRTYFQHMRGLKIPTIEREVLPESFQETRSDCRPADFGGGLASSRAGMAQTLVANSVPKCAMCVGFIIGHRICCANRVGQGVCAGAPSDCHHLNCRGCLESEGCPEGGADGSGCGR